MYVYKDIFYKVPVSVFGFYDISILQQFTVFFYLCSAHFPVSHRGTNINRRFASSSIIQFFSLLAIKLFISQQC